MKTTPQNPPPYPPLFGHPGSEHQKAEKKNKYLDNWVRFACAAMSAVGASDPNGEIVYPDQKNLAAYAGGVADYMMDALKETERTYDWAAEEEEEEAVEKLKNTPPE